MRNSFVTEHGKEKYITYINVNEEYFEVNISVYRRPIGFWQWVACILWDASYGEMVDSELFCRDNFGVNSNVIPTAQQIIDKAKVYTNNAIMQYYAKHIREIKLKNLQKILTNCLLCDIITIQ